MNAVGAHSTPVDNNMQSLAASFVEYTNENLFITGKAGTGKTTFLKTVIVKSAKNKIVLAPTGIAALNAEGTTVNAFFQIPPGFYLPDGRQIRKVGFYAISDVIRNLNYSPAKKELIKRLDLIVIDEVSMVRADQLDLLDHILRFVKGNSKPFGNIQMAFMGDLFQLPPVLKNEDAIIYNQVYDSPFFFSASVIKHHPLLQIEFDTVYRQSDSSFLEILNQIRNNSISDNSLALLNSRYNRELSNEQNGDYITITSHNASALEINNERLNALPGNELTFYGATTGDFKDAMLPVDKRLTLKKGAQIMFIKNDTGDERRYFNGKVGKVSYIAPDAIKVVFSDNVELTVDKATWYAYDYDPSISGGSTTPVQIGSFTHYPIKLAWAATIHKSQGLTFDHAIIDAAQSFEAGQVYVALSRVRTLNGLQLRSKITRESIQSKQEVLSFYQPLTVERLLSELSKGQTNFLFDLLLKKFSLKEPVYLLRDLFARPETYKQRIDALSLEAFTNILVELETLGGIIERFQHEILEAASKNVDYSYILKRFTAAKEYLVNKIIEKIIEPFAGYGGASLSRNVNQHTKNYWENLFGLLKQIEDSVEVAVMIAKQLTEGTSEVQLLKALFQKGTTVNSPITKKVKTHKKRLTNKSTNETVELIKSGKTISDIALIRNLGISTVEGHVLEAIKEGLLSANFILEESKLSTISEAAKIAGNDVYKIKEQFGDAFSFFEIRLAIIKENS